MGDLAHNLNFITFRASSHLTYGPSCTIMCSMELSKETIANLRMVHGAFNLLLLGFFIYQARLGLRIKRARLAHAMDALANKKHRALGPVIALVLPLGFVAGATVTWLRAGHIEPGSPHFINGLLLLALVGGTYAASRKIKGEHGRALHRRLGFTTLAVFIIQFLLGVGNLL